MQNRNHWIVLLILSPFVFSFAFGLDIYVPIIPQMRDVFQTDQSLIQLTLSLFIAVNGAGQLFFGPWSDQIGRFKTAIVAAIFFAVGAGLSALSINIYMLILARAICALGASGLLVVAFAIVRDLFEDDQSARMFAYLNGAIGISPTFAPIIGGYLAVAYGWRSVFWFLLGLGLVTLLICLGYIKETHPPHKRLRFNYKVFGRYYYLFTNKRFLKYALSAGFGVSICFSFFSVSSLIIIKLLHVRVEHFGYYFALFGLVIGFGGILSGYVVEKIGINKTIYTGIIILTVGGLLMGLIYISMGLALWSFMLATVIACTGAVFLIGAGAAGAMQPFPEMAGTAAAALGCAEFVISAVVGSLLMLFPIYSSLPFAICILLVGLAAAINALLLR